MKKRNLENDSMKTEEIRNMEFFVRDYYEPKFVGENIGKTIRRYIALESFTVLVFIGLGVGMIFAALAAFQDISTFGWVAWLFGILLLVLCPVPAGLALFFLQTEALFGLEFRPKILREQFEELWTECQLKLAQAKKVDEEADD